MRDAFTFRMVTVVHDEKLGTDWSISASYFRKRSGHVRCSLSAEDLSRPGRVLRAPEDFEAIDSILPRDFLPHFLVELGVGEAGVITEQDELPFGEKE